MLESAIVTDSYRTPPDEASLVYPVAVRPAGTLGACGTIPDVSSKTQRDLDTPLISIVIPCYNQAHFLGEAIESVLKQTYRHFEIVVVNDGSTDQTSEVASLYSSIRYIKQTNQGLSAARNTGLRESKGDYLVFLDADDRLRPIALEAGLSCFRMFPQCAFVYGAYRFIAFDGLLLREPTIHRVDQEYYLALLRKNYIEMIATVMFRRDVLESVNGFDISLSACEDYDLYLRITRFFPIHWHDRLVAEYRQHAQNMSCNAQLMLETALSVIGSQWMYAKVDKRHRKAYNFGIRHTKSYYGIRLLRQVCNHIWTCREDDQAIREIKILISCVGGKMLPLYTLLWFAKLAAWKFKSIFAWAEAAKNH